MKLAIILAILVILVGGCLGPTTETTHTISGTQDLVLSEQDLQQLRMMSEGSCQTEEYQTNGHSPLAQYSICNYTINSLDDTEVVLQLKKFTNLEDLNGAYQYDSLHLYSVEGLINENKHGDQSRFRVNHENDYGGQYNDPTVYYYHLWICKNEYLVHITSKGSKEAKEYIEKIGRQILSKFE